MALEARCRWDCCLVATALMVNAQRTFLVLTVGSAASVVLEMRNGRCNSLLRGVDCVAELLPETYVFSGKPEGIAVGLTYLLFHHTYTVSWVDVWSHGQALHWVVRALGFRRMSVTEELLHGSV